MKQYLNTYFAILTLLVILNARSSLVIAQESAEKESPNLEFSYLKKSDGSKLLTASLTIFRNRITYPIVGNKISFFLGNDTATAIIATNSEGKAYLLIQSGAFLPVNTEGFTSCTVQFEGNDTLDAAESSIQVKDAVLKMSLDLLDSVKTVNVWAFLPGNTNDSIPLTGEAVKIYVSRMFSLLLIGEGSLDDQGRYSFAFPADLPGEADGSVEIIARIEENDQYANIEAVKNYVWGVPSMHGQPGTHRALWTEIAPLWMIITLTILLSGVWGHYIYVIIQIILIRRESKKSKE